MIGSKSGSGFSDRTDEGSSKEGRLSLSNDGKRGESMSKSTLGGARPTEDIVVAVVSALPLLAELADMPNRRVMLGFDANNGDLRGLSLSSGALASDDGVRGLPAPEVDGDVFGISTGGMVVSPKSIRLAIWPAADGGGGAANNSSLRSISSEKTLPGMLSEGPRESMSARIVMRFVA